MNTTTFDELAIDRPAPGILGLAERGLLPDALLRAGIRRNCRERLREESAGGWDAQEARLQQRLAELRGSAVAIETDAANRQHYELPPDFFALCLGHRRKYSCCWYATGDETLDQAEDAMLALTCERAELADGQDILELGCGWGSLTLWMAERYPGARITAVSNSAPQRRHIEAQCQARGFSNVTVITEDVNRLARPAASADRVVSVEMFEHVRNYRLLMDRIGEWLRPGGALFVHHFAHRTLLYPFETAGSGNWMGRHFFTGGLMPAADTLLWFQGAMRAEARWGVDGSHYQRTADHWLARQDSQRDAVMAVLEQAYGPALSSLWWQRWRLFWMACAEMFGLDRGQEWGVVHWRFRRG